MDDESERVDAKKEKDALMNVLVIGGGGREHALVWLASQSNLVKAVFCPTQNPGITAEPKWTDGGIEPKDNGYWARYALRNGIDLVLVGPEAPLAAGIVDTLRTAGITVFGPTQQAAQLESDKIFAKGVMREAKVPTADYVVFEKHERDEAKGYITKFMGRFVVKAYGLAAGKGAIVCHNLEQGREAIDRCFDDEFGSAGDKILIEDFLESHPKLKRAEVSVLALVAEDGSFIMMPAAQDYKPIGENDTGPNTGGMGSFAPIPWITPEMMDEIGKKIFAPIIAEMKKLGIPFSGVLYAGLMWTPDGPKVVEFNVRFGDPEIQPLAMLLDCDIIPVLKAIAEGKSIADMELKWKDGFAVCVVSASGGYPGSVQKGAKIAIVEQRAETISPKSSKRFHAGTGTDADGKLVTAGGRVFGSTSLRLSLEAAAKAAYEVASGIVWRDENGNGPYTRPDIGKKVPTSLS